MGKLQDTFDEKVKELPARAMQKVLEPKLRAAGIRHYKKIAEGLAAHLLSGKKSKFEWGSGDTNEDIVIEFNKDDAEELERLVSRVTDDLPKIIDRLATAAATRMVDRFTSEWKQSRYLEERAWRQFQLNIETLWGQGLDNLRILLEVSRQIGEKFYDRIDSEESNQKSVELDTALARLHIRSCQISGEIIVLLENGYPDGALARWRTLHEISVVATLLKDAGNELAQRYLDHEIVEQKKALDRFIIDHADLGFKPPRARERKQVENLYARMIAKYGAPFATEYGWAADHLKLARPRFIDIQDAAGQAPMHSHYKMASYNVHAGARALSFRVGTLDDFDLLISGATNAGLEEAGHKTAISLTKINSLLLESEQYQIDDFAFMKTIIEIRDTTVEAFIQADKQLRIDDKEALEAMSFSDASSV